MTSTWIDRFRVCKDKRVVTLLLVIENPNDEVSFLHSSIVSYRAVLGHSVQSSVTVTIAIYLSLPRLDRLWNWFSNQRNVRLRPKLSLPEAISSLMLYAFVVLSFAAGTNLTQLLNLCASDIVSWRRTALIFYLEDWELAHEGSSSKPALVLTVLCHFSVLFPLYCSHDWALNQDHLKC
jgi:hypothetical protein